MLEDEALLPTVVQKRQMNRSLNLIDVALCCQVALYDDKRILLVSADGTPDHDASSTVRLGLKKKQF